MTPSHSLDLARWVLALRADGLPADIVETVKLRLLDTVGLILAAADTPLAQAARAGALAMGAGADSRFIGYGDRSSAMLAALVGGTLAHAMDFDDTHEASLVHPSAAIIPAALAVGEKTGATGAELTAAIATGSEISCRLGEIVPMAFHKQGFHPTGLLNGFGAAMIAGRLLGLDEAALQAAAGINGSQASGLLESFSDGTWVKTLHPGWAAAGGIAAAHLAQAGFTGPATVFEGRFGVINAFAGQTEPAPDFGRLTTALGEDWAYRRSSIKPYPCAHVIHPFVDLAIALHEKGFRAADIVAVSAPIDASYMPVVGEPRDAKLRPVTPTHARVSLPYCVAAAFQLGHCGVDAFSDETIGSPEILDLADRITPVPIDPPPRTVSFEGRLVVETRDGAVVERHQPHHRGSNENPMTRAEVEAKFDDNARRRVSPARVRTLRAMIDDLPTLTGITAMIDATIDG